MGLIRTYILVFIVGWGLWFWLDKDGGLPAQTPPPYVQVPPAAYRGVPGPTARPTSPAPFQEELVGEFQHGFDLLKAGFFPQAFVFLWRRQSWILAGVITLLFALLSPGLLRIYSRLRTRRPGGNAGGRSGAGGPSPE